MNDPQKIPRSHKPFWVVLIALLVIGLGTFLYGLSGDHPERAWQAYLINFLLWSAVAQGAVVFSAVMRITNARWSGPLAGLSESFIAFFPLSFLLFLLMFLGRTHLFPWLHEDLHGKEVWLNIPFLFTRDCIGLIILYGLGMVYVYHALRLKVDPARPGGRLRRLLFVAPHPDGHALERIQNRTKVIGGFYILAFALVLSLIGYDLVMSMDPHWVSTLFGAYNFVKAFYVGLGGLIILAAVFHWTRGDASGLTDNHFHDIGKLFFGFCLLWADFFYVQLVVIWYGNIPEETHYVITRTMLAPWNTLAWSVFIVCFLLPFVILLNKKIKTKPLWMLTICSVIIIGIWFEHLLLLAPALQHKAETLALGPADGLISLGFLSLVALSVFVGLKTFPELTRVEGNT